MINNIFTIIVGIFGIIQGIQAIVSLYDRHKLKNASTETKIEEDIHIDKKEFKWTKYKFSLILAIVPYYLSGIVVMYAIYNYLPYVTTILERIAVFAAYLTIYITYPLNIRNLNNRGNGKYLQWVIGFIFLEGFIALMVNGLSKYEEIMTNSWVSFTIIIIHVICLQGVKWLYSFYLINDKLRPWYNKMPDS